MTDDTVDITDVSPSTLVGRRVAKRFRTGIFVGTITETWIDDDKFDQYWRVLFDDTDVHDLTLTELTTALQLYKLYPTEYCFPPDDTTPTPTPVAVPTFIANDSISSTFRGAPSTQASQSVVSDFRGAQPLRTPKPLAPVVSVEAIRMGFLIAQMHKLKCVAGDVGNAFLTSYTTEKLFIIAGPEFGPALEGK